MSLDFFLRIYIVHFVMGATLHGSIVINAVCEASDADLSFLDRAVLPSVRLLGLNW